MTTKPSILDSITVSPEEGRAVPDAATRKIIGYAPKHEPELLNTLMEDARQAQPGWAALGHAERSRILNAIADDLEANLEELAVLLSREQGKPLDGPNARFEIGAAATWTRDAANTPVEPEVIVDDNSGRVEVHYDPLGVVAAIGP